MSDDARVVDTPFGPGVSLYLGDPRCDVLSEYKLLFAVWERAVDDAEWLDELEAKPRSTWTPSQVTQYRRVTHGVLDPRTWLAEQRAA